VVNNVGKLPVIIVIKDDSLATALKQMIEHDFSLYPNGAFISLETHIIPLPLWVAQLPFLAAYIAASRVFVKATCGAREA